jgi:AcrR family transcriptional regulator
MASKPNTDRSDFNSVSVQIHVDQKLFVKNPNSSVLGRKIIRYSIDMIEDMGFESFTFKKLANHIDTTEASVYRYFESKHKLLLYLLAWYWNWMDYKLLLSMANLSSPEDRLRIALRVITDPIEKDTNFEYVDETALYRIVVGESSKVYLIKEVDKVNKEGLFQGYKRLCSRIAAVITEINPDYRYPKALISTVIETSHDQKFFAEHLPSLTDITQKKLSETTDFVTELVMKTIARK